MSATILRRGMTAAVSGASSGIGRKFAEVLAARGISLILIARREDRLRELAQTLAREHGVNVEVLAADLADVAESERAARTLGERPVDILINNAGVGTYGDFASIDPQSEAREIAVNVRAPVVLAHAVVPGMIARKRGGIVNVASTAAFQGVPYMATYGATKAFVLSFSNALTYELKPHGIHVLALCPGFTKTEFAGLSGESSSGQPRLWRSTDQVVTTALRALERGRMTVVDGPLNAAVVLLEKFSPRVLNVAIAARVMKQAQQHA